MAIQLYFYVTFHMHCYQNLILHYFLIGFYFVFHPIFVLGFYLGLFLLVCLCLFHFHFLLLLLLLLYPLNLLIYFHILKEILNLFLYVFSFLKIYLSFFFVNFYFLFFPFNFTFKKIKNKLFELFIIFSSYKKSNFN